MARLTITIDLPDGVGYRLTVPEPEPSSVLNEPLPPEPGNEYTSPPTGYTSPETSSARRGIAIQQGVVWAAGQVHLAGHKPLKAGAKGLFCATLLGTDPDGTKHWCSFRP